MKAKAINDDINLAASIGLNYKPIRLAIFFLSGIITSFAGLMWSGYVSFIDPSSFSLTESINIVVIAIIGSEINYVGSIVGALLFIAMAEILDSVGFSSEHAAYIRLVLFYSLILIVYRFKNRIGLIMILRIEKLKYLINRNQTIIINNLKLERGTLTRLSGSNGSGKSVLLNIINGFYKNYHGTIQFKNNDIKNLSPSKLYQNGLVRSWQDHKIFDSLTVLQHLRICSKSGSIINKTIDFFDLNSIIKKKGHSLSSGQKKMVGLAMLNVISNVEKGDALILLDEPFSSLDHQKSQIIKKVINHWIDVGNTILIIEHGNQINNFKFNQNLFIKNGEVVQK